ncbi:hypothetical protein ACFQI7_20200 [Paenibacillus allorhizosphaerae]|uniref:PPM-type phosphatase domain-containing protein n=1 Tax=Paenibacillus allorhizosphaerae TaxID=2849866 RepID=A0ABN7TR77_9BACL|nr:hypothetical protein [Paenibacillus allorhizosphaerae]CAG7647450.1 hypothetical protein PAECIP111802_03977 [Paenibacillus allorhizosphaerae]
MEVIEASVLSKTGDPQTCEDRYCVTEDYACVIDGATDVSGKRYNGRTSGQVISGVIAETIPMLPADADIREIIDIINETLIRYYKAQEMYDSVTESPYTRPTAAMILYSRSRHTVWMVGDCQCMIDEEAHTNPKIVDDIIANTRSLFLEAEIRKGKTVEELLEKDTGFEAVRPFIQMQYYMQNLQEPNQYGYIAVTGFPFDLGQIKTVCVKPDATSLALASDGYPTIRPTLQQSEDALRDIQECDPLCFREYKLAKGLVKGNASFDDRTYIRLRLKPR